MGNGPSGMRPFVRTGWPPGQRQGRATPPWGRLPREPTARLSRAGGPGQTVRMGGRPAGDRRPGRAFFGCQILPIKRDVFEIALAHACTHWSLEVSYVFVSINFSLVVSIPILIKQIFN